MIRDRWRADSSRARGGSAGLELETAVRERADVTIVVFRNGLHGTIAMHQARLTGRLSGVSIGEIGIAHFADSLGASGFTVDDEADLIPVLKEAHGMAGPSVVEVVTDPDVISPTARLSELLDHTSARLAGAG